MKLLLTVTCILLLSSCKDRITTINFNEAQECKFDSSEIFSLRKENKKVRKDLYWQRWRTDSLRIQCHEKDAIINSPSIFKVIHFDSLGNKI